jgi:hypothetical protein
MNFKKSSVTKNRTLWASALIAIIALAGLAVAGDHEHESHTYKISESGSFFSGIQQNGAYGLATFDLAITAGQGGGFGQTNTQARFVWDYSSIGPNPDSDSGTYPYVMHLSLVSPRDKSNFVLRAENGDLLFGEPDATSTNKFKDSGAFKLNIAGAITGGTGKFAGATGTFVTESKGATLPGPGGYFGWVESKSKISIDR